MFFLLQGGHHPQFVGRGNAGVNLNVFHLALKIGLVHLLQLRPGDDPPLLQQPQLASHRLGGQRMVAGNHHRFDAGLLAQFDGRFGLRPGRVDHPHQPQEGHLLLGAFQSDVCFGGHGQHSQGLGSHVPGGVQNSLPPGFIQYRFSFGGQVAGAGGQNYFRGAFGVGRHPLRLRVEGGHTFTFGGKGDFADAGERFIKLCFLQPGFGCRYYQRPFGGIAFHLPAADGFIVKDVGVRGQRGGP
jgi:hypothetical protein